MIVGTWGIGPNYITWNSGGVHIVFCHPKHIYIQEFGATMRAPDNWILV